MFVGMWPFLGTQPRNLLTKTSNLEQQLLPSITLPHFQSEISLIDSTQRWVPINSRKGMPAVPIGVDMPMGDRRPIGVRRPMGVRRPKDKILRSRVAFTENEAVLY